MLNGCRDRQHDATPQGQCAGVLPVHSNAGKSEPPVQLRFEFEDVSAAARRRVRGKLFANQFNDGQVVVGDLPHRQAPGDAKDDQAKTDRRRQTGMVTIQVPFW